MAKPAKKTAPKPAQKSAAKPVKKSAPNAPRRKTRNPFVSFAVINLLMAAILTIFLWLRLELDPFSAWLIAINLTALLVYATDKNLAETRRLRVPEKLLLLLALLFGSLGALLGMLIFRHKTAKPSFQARFWIIVSVQILLTALYYAYILPLLR